MRPSTRVASSHCGQDQHDLPRSGARRTLLLGALVGGVASVAPWGRAEFGAPLAGGSLRAAPLRQSSSRTLTLVTNRAPSDLDPHSAFDPGSGMLLQGPFEGL